MTSLTILFKSWDRNNENNFGVIHNFYVYHFLFAFCNISSLDTANHFYNLLYSMFHVWIFSQLFLLQNLVSPGYNVTIDENTPPGLTIFRGITALDTDKPNTPNSDVQYSIIGGNEERKFSIEGNLKAVVVLRKGLDYERGDRLFNLTILARVG